MLTLCQTRTIDKKNLLNLNSRILLCCSLEQSVRVFTAPIDDIPKPQNILIRPWNVMSIVTVKKEKKSRKWCSDKALEEGKK